MRNGRTFYHITSYQALQSSEKLWHEKSDATWSAGSSKKESLSLQILRQTARESCADL